MGSLGVARSVEKLDGQHDMQACTRIHRDRECECRCMHMMRSLAIQYTNTPHPITPAERRGVLPTVKEAAALALAYGIDDGQRVGTAAWSVRGGAWTTVRGSVQLHVECVWWGMHGNIFKNNTPSSKHAPHTVSTSTVPHISHIAHAMEEPGHACGPSREREAQLQMAECILGVCRSYTDRGGDEREFLAATELFASCQ
jgi:hypothetical protein